MSKRSHIVVIGGGTGTSVVLEGLKKYPVDLSAVITTADDGSSSGVFRRKFRMVPPGDIRQCLVALASKNYGYLNERFQKGFLEGHTLGNILISFFYQKKGNFQQAIDELLELTGVGGSLISMTLEPAVLIAKLKDGRVIRGERNITPSREIREKLDRLVISPASIQANPRAVQAIESADMIVVGPGNLFSSLIPNVLVKDIREAIIRARAKKVYVANLFTQPGHTDNFTVTDFLSVFEQYIGEDVFHHIVYNSRPLPREIYARYANAIVGTPVGASPSTKRDKRFIARSLARSSPRIIRSDPIAQIRNPFLHDSGKLARAIMELV